MRFQRSGNSSPHSVQFRADLLRYGRHNLTALRRIARNGDQTCHILDGHRYDAVCSISSAAKSRLRHFKPINQSSDVFMTRTIQMIKGLKRAAKRMLNVRDVALRTEIAIDDLKILTARSLIDRIKSYGIYESIQDAEFKVFSQFGDDGIIQYLIYNVEIGHRNFVEFGIEDYTESNTRFLLMNDNWSGLVMDGNKSNIDRVRHDEMYWKYDLIAMEAFVTRENINECLVKNNFTNEIGILSIDVDGNDYWIWESIHVIDPVIVIVEYNSVFGYDHAITIPYDPNFIRSDAHRSNLYWGASLRAICLLADRKGYYFVGSNSAGNNAYFVKKDKAGNLRTFDARTGYVKSKFRESRDSHGRLTFLAFEDRLKEIRDKQVYDVETGIIAPIRDLQKKV